MQTVGKAQFRLYGNGRKRIDKNLEPGGVHGCDWELWLSVYREVPGHHVAFRLVYWFIGWTRVWLMERICGQNWRRASVPRERYLWLFMVWLLCSIEEQTTRRLKSWTWSTTRESASGFTRLRDSGRRVSDIVREWVIVVITVCVISVSVVLVAVAVLYVYANKHRQERRSVLLSRSAMDEDKSQSLV